MPLAPIMTKEIEQKSLSEETAQGLFEQIKKMSETLKKYKEL